MINMARSEEEDAPETMEQPIYPYGLCICLTSDELEKLDLDADAEVGDMIHITAMAKVTSISKRATTEGEDCRIELQITDIGLENEEEEGDEEEIDPRIRRKVDLEKFYK